MKLVSVKINKKSIVYAAVFNKDATEADSVASKENRTVTCYEVPLPAFDKAMTGLIEPAISFLELPADYKKGVSVVAFSIGETKKGTRSISIEFDKKLDTTGESHRFKTPFIRIDKPVEGEQAKPVADNKSKARIAKAIEAATAYANGDRSQTLLDFKEEENEDDDHDPDQEEMNLEGE